MLEQIARDLSEEVGRLSFGLPVAHVYNPLEYAWAPHQEYLRRYGSAPKEVILLGMNPGPWGMAQTGVPFGEVAAVREWLGIEAGVGRPAEEHPGRRVEGFACRRSEVSGRRVWGWASAIFGTPEAFFARFLVANYCPLLLLEASGRNLTPDRLPGTRVAPLLAACDRALRRTVELLRPEVVVGVGSFAAGRARLALDGLPVRVGRTLHPSPASPAANRGWAAAVNRDLALLGIRLPEGRGEPRLTPDSRSWRGDGGANR